MAAAVGQHGPEWGQQADRKRARDRGLPLSGIEIDSNLARGMEKFQPGREIGAGVREPEPQRRSRATPEPGLDPLQAEADCHQGRAKQFRYLDRGAEDLQDAVR